MTPESVAQEIRAFREKWPNADYGIGHIVLSDYNLSRDHIWSCFEPENFKNWQQSRLQGLEGAASYIDYFLELGATIAFLQYLMQFDDAFLERIAEALEELP